jgi:hypothetical protein
MHVGASTQGQRMPNVVSPLVAGGTQGGVHIVGGVVRGGLQARNGGRIVLDGDVIVGEGVPLTTDVGSVIEAKKAFLGNRFVDDVEITAQHVDGITSTQVTSPLEAVVSAIGSLPDKYNDPERVGGAVAEFLGGSYLVVPEQKGERGARQRDGTLDDQVDVFLQATSDDPDDVRLQVVFLPAVAGPLGKYDTAIDLVLDDQAIRDAIAFKRDFTDKDTIDLVVSCPIPIAPPRRRALSTGANRFGKHGYSRVWLVDADDWVVALGE